MSRRRAPPPKKTRRASAVARSGTVALVGRSNVGKSTLMNALLGEDLAIVAPTAQTTRHRILGVVRHGDAEIALLDTPGLHKPKNRLGKLMNHAARSAVADADVVVFVTDPDPRQRGEMKILEGDRVLLADVGNGKPTILALNKVDQVTPRSKMLPWLGAMAKLRDFAAVVPISAKTSDGTERLLDEIAKLLPERGARLGDDDLTDRPVRFFVGEFVRGEILRVARAEVPYAVAVTVERYDETGRVPKIAATVHVEREGQKAIVIGKGGERLKEIGTHARERVERLVGRQVHLELFVRVTPGWSDDPNLLLEMGYDETGGGGEP